MVVETGTNWGASTIVMAQALKDLGTTAKVRTVEMNESLVEIAKRNVEKAGLTDQVEFHVEDSLSFLARTADEVDQFDFIFIDDDHRAEHVIKELAIVCPKIAPRTGKIYLRQHERRRSQRGASPSEGDLRRRPAHVSELLP